MPRVLFADDQIPDSTLFSCSDDEIRDHYTKLYRKEKFAEEFAEGFVFMRRLVNLLKSRGYQVDTADTPATVSDLAKRTTYSVIVLDLGWWTVQDMSYEDKMVLGWSLAAEIRQNSSAPILMFSNRFDKDAELARTTAEKGCLPVYKSYDEACGKHLIVTMLWAALQKSFAETLDDEERIHSFRMYKRLSAVLLASIVCALLLLVVTVVLVVAQQTKFTIASSAFGIVTTFVSGVVYKYVAEYRKSIRRQDHRAHGHNVRPRGK